MFGDHGYQNDDASEERWEQWRDAMTRVATAHGYKVALLEVCAREGVQVVAQSPLAHGGAAQARLLAAPALLAIADAHGRSPAQVVLE